MKVLPTRPEIKPVQLWG